MTVHELIAKLEELPRNALVVVKGNDDYVTPQPEQVWNDHAENYIVVL